MAVDHRVLKQYVKQLLDDAFLLLEDLQYDGNEEIIAKDVLEYMPALKSRRLPFAHLYELWYTKASLLVKQLLPHRYEDFTSHYSCDKPRKDITADNYSIQDWILGFRAPTRGLERERSFADKALTIERFSIQFQIVGSLLYQADKAMLDIQRLVQADLLGSELDASRELLEKGFIRPAGVLAGVVLESHLKQCCSKRPKIKFKKKNPGIAEYNEALKSEGVFDTVQWRKIQSLADTRNVCGHDKGVEPTKEDVQEMIKGVDRVCKNVF